METSVKNKETFIWITNDYVFKKVFSNKVILKDFINSYLEYCNIDLKIKSLSVKVLSKQKYIQSDHIKLKDYYLDIFIIFSNKEIINLEMYNNFGVIEIKKSLSYGCYLYSHQIKKGNKFSDAQKVISLNIIGSNFKVEDDDLVISYELINKKTRKKLLSDGIEFVLITLDNLKKIEYSINKLRFIKWLRFINCKNKREVSKFMKGDKIFMSTKKLIDEFVNDPDVIKIWHGDSWKVESAELRGREEGLVEGRDERDEEIARNMLEKNYSIKQISDITNLSAAQIRTLKK